MQNNRTFFRFFFNFLVSKLHKFSETFLTLKKTFNCVKCSRENVLGVATLLSSILSCFCLLYKELPVNLKFRCITVSIMILILLFLTAITVITVRLYRKVLRFPPGPFPLPLIGNAHQIAYQAWRRGGILPALDYYRKVLEIWTEIFQIRQHFRNTEMLTHSGWVRRRL